MYCAINRLTGRGVVEFTVEKGDGSTFVPTAGGESKSVATVQVAVCLIMISSTVESQRSCFYQYICLANIRAYL
jgi:hypothetical protein